MKQFTSEKLKGWHGLYCIVLALMRGNQISASKQAIQQQPLSVPKEKHTMYGIPQHMNDHFTI
eukprot:scaffold108982_cov18-Prasinocladus_malaysianus.AAC.1